MTNPESIDEKAIREQVEASLNQMDKSRFDLKDDPSDADGPDDGEESKSGKLPTGTIASIDGNSVFVELGPRTQGVITIDEFDEPPQPGQTYEFSLVSIQDGLWTLSRREARALATWKELEKGRQVKATVIGENSGGLEMKIGPVGAFMPASEIDLKRIESFTEFVGQTMVCEVIEVARRRKRVVISRRLVLAKERRESRTRTMESMTVGQVVRGTVEKLEPFGAFVDIGGGVSGLLHVSNLSHQRVQDPASVLTPGQVIEVQILEIKNGGKRIGLGMKQLQADPWDGVEKRYRPGSVLTGKVIRIAEFGAFVEVMPGIEGLLHKSQLSPDRVNRVEDAVAVGGEVTVRVVSVDPAARRLSLSRLSERGHLIGSEEDVGGEEINSYLHKGDGPVAGTNLGALLREAMENAAKRPNKR